MVNDEGASNPDSSLPPGEAIGPEDEQGVEEGADRSSGGQGRPTAADVAARVAPYKWKPGQSGNPSGRAKGTSQKMILDTFRQIVKEDPRVLPTMVKAWIARSMQPGGAGYARLVFEMCDGKVPLPIKLAAQAGDEESGTELRISVIPTPELPDGANLPIEVEAKGETVAAEGKAEGPRGE